MREMSSEDEVHGHKDQMSKTDPQTGVHYRHMSTVLLFTEYEETDVNADGTRGGAAL